MKAMVIVFALLVSASLSSALTLKEKKKFAEWNEEIKNENGAKVTKRNCGYDIPVKIDEKLVTPFMEENTSAEAYCVAALDAIGTMCGDATAKAEITKKVKAVDCQYNKAKEADISLKGTTLVFKVAPGIANLEDKVKDYLENHL